MVVSQEEFTKINIEIAKEAQTFLETTHEGTQTIKNSTLNVDIQV